MNVHVFSCRANVAFSAHSVFMSLPPSLRFVIFTTPSQSPLHDRPQFLTVQLRACYPCLTSLYGGSNCESRIIVFSIVPRLAITYAFVYACRHCCVGCCISWFARYRHQIYDKFVSRVTELAAKLRQGPVLGKDTVDVGAMVMPAQLDIVQVGRRVAMYGRGAESLRLVNGCIRPGNSIHS